ncbi:serine/threonine-protein kinase ATM-like isoform X4 [Primulina tabacum]|uniref:serine/threonine-protein kinase ATM-like isoform X4 n=1 Tax=Primulina tabacum TaxID=48773 RepID=UPI003F599940
MSLNYPNKGVISRDRVNFSDEALGYYLLKRPIQVSCHWQKEQHRGFLSTENGQRALMQLHSFERSLIEVHSKGVNLELMQRLISNLQRKLTAESISIEDSNVDNFG